MKKYQVKKSKNGYDLTEDGRTILTLTKEAKGWLFKTAIDWVYKTSFSDDFSCLSGFYFDRKKDAIDTLDRLLNKGEFELPLSCARVTL